MIKNQNISCVLCENNNCLFKQCDIDFIQRLNPGKSSIFYKKGQYIFKERTPVYGIFFIKKGKIKVKSSGLNGLEQIVRLAGEGHIIGHRGYAKETYPISAVAIEDSWICFLDNASLMDAFKVNFEFLYELMMFYSVELRRSELRAKYFSQMTVIEKVIFSLCYIIEIYGFNKDKKTIAAQFSRKEIAEISGTNPEQVSRSIASLKKQKIISTQSKHILIENFEQMKKIIFPYTIGFFPYP